jgi:hypothetical protein
MRWSGGEGASITTKVSDSISNYASERSIQGGGDIREIENLATRPLVLGVVATCMSVPIDSVQFLKGEMLFNNIIWSIPRKLFPTKEEFLIMEDLLFEEFHDPLLLTDQADSFALYAYSEFGYLGWILYPIILSLSWILALVILMKIKNNVIFLILFSMWPSYWIFSLLEGTPSDFITRLRTCIFILFVYYVYTNLFKKKLLINYEHTLLRD